MERRTLRRIVVNRLDEISSLRERRRKGREGVSGCEQEEGREDEEEKRREEETHDPQEKHAWFAFSARRKR